MQAEGSVAACHPASSCSVSHEGCIQDSRKECVDFYPRPVPQFPNTQIEQCPIDYRGRYRPCTNLDEQVDDATIHLSSVSTSVLSDNPQYYRVNVSWTVVGSSKSSSGRYEVKIVGKEGRIRDCVCIKNSSILNVTFVGFEYNGNGDVNQTAEVIPYPLSEHIREGSAKVVSVFSRPVGCADAIIGNTKCDIKAYGRPKNLIVLSSVLLDGTKQLAISWLPPSGVPHPEIYYLQLHSNYSGPLLHRFKVVNITNIVIDNLNASLVYEVRLQSYRKCSGVGNFFEEYRLGCGRVAVGIEELSDIVTTTEYHDTTTDDVTTKDVTTDASASPLYLLSIPGFLIVIVVIVVIVVPVILTRVRIKPYKENEKPTSMEFKVFVFYCSATPQEDVIYIQKHVVGALSHYFEVCSPSDFKRGNTSVRLEEAVRTSDKVLLVCNQEMYNEWCKGDRDPALNSLHHLILAAVSSNNIAKFGVILTRKGEKETCIPDDSYIRLMNVFNIKEGSDLEDVYKFVTHSPTFQISSTGSTPTSEGPAHVAICAVE